MTDDARMTIFLFGLGVIILFGLIINGGEAA
jgi:hypothetical protein